ncbi:hypothetical protein ABTY20_25630 [Streptomyces sp. NPDC126497]|uniref:DUF6895 family protein n=1 Tax=Streptomyces sp. NPDC126497 TaxID=3155313 RepID=UPI003329C1C2
MTAPGARDIRRVAEDALAWVAAHRARFALGEDALAADGRVDGTWKPLGELAQVCATVVHRTVPTDPLHARAGELLEFAWRQTREGGTFSLLQRLEPFATYPLEVYAAFASAGFRHPAYEEAAAVAARTRGWRLTEQDPTRRLGVLKAEERCGIHRPEPVPALLPRTWLGGLPEPWTFERAAGYALTHVVFHLTDWGRADDALPPDLADYLADWLPPWLDTCLDAGMWDLSSELLAAAATLPRPLDDVVPPDAWQRLAAARDPSGAIREEGRDTADGETRDPERYFATHYHSTLLAAFAAVLTTARPAGAPAGAGTRHGRQGAPA